MDSLLSNLKSSSPWIGIGLLLISVLNHRHAVKQQDEAWDMEPDTETGMICRQIRLLETRVWVQSWWIISAIAIGIIVLGLK